LLERLRRTIAVLSGFGLTLVAGAAELPAVPVSLGLSFEEASSELLKLSDTLAATDANLQAAQSQAESLKWLHGPTLSLDAQELEYQKTLNVPLGDLRGQAQSTASSALSGINAAGVPGVPASAVGAVTGQIQQALPSIFASIPDTLSVHTRNTVFHPTATALIQLYSGGAIPAVQGAARSAVALAQAQLAGSVDALQLELVQTYFGQVLAAQALAIAREIRAGFDRHLEDAHKLETHGLLSHTRRLQVQVARDSAQRAEERAEGDFRTAVDTLAHLVHRGHAGVTPTTALFVLSRPLEPIERFLDSADAGHPKLRAAEATVDAARQGAKLAHSQQLPSVYAFGSYNLNRHDELVTEPDWIVGVGVHYTLFSNTDRHKVDRAARERQRAAEAAERQTRIDLSTSITRAYDFAETARRQFLELDSSLAAATEALRAQEISYREGEATNTEVIDARNTLGQAKVQRAAAAYEYDIALAELLLASGESRRFTDYLQSADHRLTFNE
jgi:outer membrane protein TolC